MSGLQLQCLTSLPYHYQWLASITCHVFQFLHYNIHFCFLMTVNCPCSILSCRDSWWEHPRCQLSHMLGRWTRPFPEDLSDRLLLKLSYPPPDPHLTTFASVRGLCYVFSTTYHITHILSDELWNVTDGIANPQNTRKQTFSMVAI